MPGLNWPLETTRLEEDGFLSQRQPFAPDTPLLLDFMEFVYAAVAKPILGKHHDSFSHHHLTFDQEAGREEFRATVNRLADVPAVLALIERFYDPLIARGATRAGDRDAVLAEAA